MSAAFAFYDWFVWKRNDKVFSAAVRSGAIVSSLFPSAVRERLYEEADEKQAQVKLRKNGNASQKWLSDDLVDPTFQSEIDGEFLPYKTKPIADRKGRIELCDVTFPTLLTYSSFLLDRQCSQRLRFSLPVRFLRSMLIHFCDHRCC